MLGVTTEKDEKGAKVNDITKESAAEKIGLKEGDIITKIDDQKIENPDDLSEAITKHKPGEKVTVSWLRDNKEQKATAELTKWKGVNVFGSTMPGQQFKMDMGDMNFENILPRLQGLQGLRAVSYTHLDVYKRQVTESWIAFPFMPSADIIICEFNNFIVQIFLFHE